MREAFRIWTQGALAMGYVVVAFYFIRYWRETHERVFIFFSAGFVTLAAQRLLLGLSADLQITFSLRLAGYLLVLAGIIAQRTARRDAAG